MWFAIPLVSGSEWPVVKILSGIGMGPALAVLFTWIYNRTGGNLLPAAVLHTAINNTSRVIPETPWVDWVGLMLAIVLIFTGRMWRRRADG